MPNRVWRCWLIFAAIAVPTWAVLGWAADAQVSERDGLDLPDEATAESELVEESEPIADPETIEESASQERARSMSRNREEDESSVQDTGSSLRSGLVIPSNRHPRQSAGYYNSTPTPRYANS